MKQRTHITTISPLCSYHKPKNQEAIKIQLGSETISTFIKKSWFDNIFKLSNGP